MLHVTEFFLNRNFPTLVILLLAHQLAYFMVYFLLVSSVLRILWISIHRIVFYSFGLFSLGIKCFENPLDKYPQDCLL